NHFLFDESDLPKERDLMAHRKTVRLRAKDYLIRRERLLGIKEEEANDLHL
ncbi:MAG: hypothetical protein G01um101472_469, partial [Parcubacteria group bacterium Gr01-1014_72]